MFRNVLLFTLLTFPAFAFAQDAELPRFIQRVDFIHHSHTDIGYTDHPMVTRQRQTQYLDIAIDAVLATKDLPEYEKFTWTAEAGISVADWWREADAARRKEFLTAIKTGQLEIAALAMNQSPLMNARQWDMMPAAAWMPKEVAEAAKIQAALQNDVNGCPRAGALRLLDAGVSNLWMSINTFNGGSPIPQPGAFWWKMPDGRRLFVWQNPGYGNGFYYFHDFDWRRGPVPESTDTRYRLPRKGEIFRTDEESLRRAHRHLCEHLRHMENSGYRHSLVALSFTNQWRVDNDPPELLLPEFMAAWNRLGLKPEIRLTTAAAAMNELREVIGDHIPELEGEFTDWWANGSASGPREVAASRQAKRLLAAAMNPVFGPLSASARKKEEAALWELCLFDEHTWGSVDSVGRPHDLEILGQYNEKSRYAYLAVAQAKMLLSQRARTAVYPREAGYYVVNASPEPFSGWVTALDTAFREHVVALRNTDTDVVSNIERRPGFLSFTRPNSPADLSPESDQGTVADYSPGQAIRFWVHQLPGNSITKFVPAEVEKAISEKNPAAHATVKTDENGWPVSAAWGDQVLFSDSPGSFISAQLAEFAGRWTYQDIRNGGDENRRQNGLRYESAIPADGKTVVEKMPYTTCYTQSMSHSRAKWMTRTLEIWESEPRARLTVRFYRISSELPEMLFIGASVHGDGNTLPLASCGGEMFTPFTDQIPGTCRDYFAVDGWLRYSSEAENVERFLVSRDAPLITFGKTPEPLRKFTAPPEGVNSVYAMIYDNTWLTNFLCDQAGIMEFQFELAMRPKTEAGNAADFAETLVSEPVFVIQPEGEEGELYMRHLHRP